MRILGSRGTLYHFTDEEGAASILDTNYMFGTKNGKDQYYGVSMTRNPRFVVRQDASVRLTFAGGKINSNYKIEPVYHEGYRDQDEEVVLARRLENVDRYLIAVDFLYDDEEDNMEFLQKYVTEFNTKHSTKVLFNGGKAEFTKNRGKI